jgi:hypothetical protein
VNWAVGAGVVGVVLAAIAVWWQVRQRPAGPGGARVDWWTCPRCRFVWYTVSPQRVVCPACGATIDDED